MSFGEAIRLVSVLSADPSSQVCASVAGWSHPVTRTDLTLRDLFDLQHATKSKRKPKPYSRPWDQRPTRTGSGTSLTVRQFRALKASITKGG